jgi:hypothetical protein
MWPMYKHIFLGICAEGELVTSSLARQRAHMSAVSVFALYTGIDKLRFHPLPSLLRGVPQQPSWEIALGFPVADFAFDPDQELLIVLESGWVYGGPI